MEKNKALTISAAAGIVLFVAIVIVLFVNNSNNNQSKTSTSDVQATISTDTPSTSKYKNGTYTASASYRTPESSEKIEIQVVVSNDTISGLTVTQKAVDRESQQYINLFKNGVNAQVVGKKLDEVSLGRVNGSSLTPIGFNAALNSIKQSALK